MERPIVFYNKGQQLNGVLHSPTASDTPCPAVAFFHGFTGTKVEPHRIFVKTARELAAIGFYALRFDFRGSGDSEGDFSEMTIGGEISDAIKSIDVLAAMPGIDTEHIGILGLSMGGCVAACVSGQDKRVKSTVMWAPLSDDPPDRKQEILERSKHTPTPEEIAQSNANVVGKAFYEELPEISPSALIQQFTGALLVIHGSGDETVPVSHGKRYYELMRGRDALTKLEIIDKGDHTFNTVAAEQAVISKSVAWFQQTLYKEAQR
ncbi:MAG: alpha/beta fold hydrolase [Candidatus Poribacteria bacterium]|nr:alpha/beta fold hydrolase [Candidatus Poribacteria bacterium]